MARPKIEIDEKQFDNLCKLQCTLQEIAGWFNCSPDTIERWCKRTHKKTFQEIWSEKSKAGLISLRRTQFRIAEHNASMAIFLGKVYLGQREDSGNGANVEDLTPLADMVNGDD